MTTCNRCGAPAHRKHYAILCEPCEAEAPQELVRQCVWRARQQAMRFRLGEYRLTRDYELEDFLRPFRELRAWARNTRGPREGAP